jgi:hypothetical protein
MNKRITISLMVVLTLAAAFMPISQMQAQPLGFVKDYGDITINQWGSGKFGEVWDLTRGDLTLEYTLDMSGIATAGWSVVEVGLREVGSPNLDPNYKGGWMQSNYIYGTSNPTSQNNNDMHLLSKHGWAEQYYDAEGADTIVTPYWSNDNYGFWLTAMVLMSGRKSYGAWKVSMTRVACTKSPLPITLLMLLQG